MEIDRIYFDMDGVLADFSGGLKTLCGIEAAIDQDAPEEVENMMWEAIRQTEGFYLKLRLVPGSRKLYRQLRALYGDKVEILTGVPGKHRRIPTAGPEKIRWAKRLLGADLKVNVVERKDKPGFVRGKGSVLIDDYAENIKLWESAGGTGILFKNAADCRAALEALDIL